jgi:hypothetical protein
MADNFIIRERFWFFRGGKYQALRFFCGYGAHFGCGLDMRSLLGYDEDYGIIRPLLEVKRFHKKILSKNIL